MKFPKKKAKKFLLFITNPRLLFCVGLAWIITNGWSYILLGLGTYYNIPWMMTVAGAYMSFLWFPFTPEKILTVIIAMALLRFLFPNDKKTLAVLQNMYESARRKHRERKERKKNR